MRWRMHRAKRQFVGDASLNSRCLCLPIFVLEMAQMASAIFARADAV